MSLNSWSPTICHHQKAWHCLCSESCLSIYALPYWRAVKSVLRYLKAHLLIAYTSNLKHQPAFLHTQTQDGCLTRTIVDLNTALPFFMVKILLARTLANNELLLDLALRRNTGQSHTPLQKSCGFNSFYAISTSLFPNLHCCYVTMWVLLFFARIQLSAQDRNTLILTFILFENKLYRENFVFHRSYQLIS